ncbi:GDSL family lipase [Loktanella sp. 22II-4b]|nr:GDSL family lipase [Loktanella sp. 22II-4b]PJJ80803.1 acyl-CoA thioesterase-1 [Brevirhabdus pacifica]
MLAAAVTLSALAAPGWALAQTVTIAAMGDSLTAGYGLRGGQGFVPQLQAWLDERGADVRLVNAGVSGDTTRGGLARLDWTLQPSVDAMILALGGNDLLRGTDPASSRRNLEGIILAAREKKVEVLLVGLVASRNFGPEFKQAFDGMYPALAERHGVLYEKDFLGPITARTETAGLLLKYLQDDRLHPNAAGVELIVENLGPRVLELAEAVRAR